MNWQALAIVLAAVVTLYFVYQRDHGRIVAKRGRAFLRCLPLLDTPSLIQDGPDYPQLAGTYNGLPVKLELIADHASFRKLPVLWLSVTVEVPLAITGVFDLMMRSQNTEFFSPHGELPQTLPTPAGWPVAGLARYKDFQSTHTIVEKLTPHVRFFSEDLKSKELLISPRGVRIVYMIDQAQWSHYLVLRHPMFENDVVDPDLVTNLIQRILSVADEFKAGKP